MCSRDGNVANMLRLLHHCQPFCSPHLRCSHAPVQGKVNLTPSTHTTETFIPEEPFRNPKKLCSNSEALSVTHELWNEELFWFLTWSNSSSCSRLGT